MVAGAILNLQQQKNYNISSGVSPPGSKFYQQSEPLQILYQRSIDMDGTRPSERRMGYQSFDQMVFTDHRGMYLDLDETSLFGSGAANLMNHDKCNLRTNDHLCVTKYITTAHQHLSDNHFWKNLDIIYRVKGSITL
eukprot:5062218-Ditylum_brightwellii.AAC.2